MPKKGKRLKNETRNSKKFKGSCECLNVSISESYKQQSFVTDVQESFLKNENRTLDNGSKIISKPFHCCVLPNFINSIEFVNHLRDDLGGLEMIAKETDLYQFKQSEDLTRSHSTHINALKNLLYGECLSLVSEITKMSLTDEVDITCAFYDYTDVLLCHDDLLEGRIVAFIYYLCENWNKDDGGTLDLFNSENGHPTDISESVVPDYNKFVFFEVSSYSFHQVAEVLKDKRRITISGWFHGITNKLAEKCTSIPSDTRILQPATLFHEDVSSWINSDYLKPVTQIQIRKTFKTTSQIQLPNFLLESRYNELSEALRSSETIWKTVGSPNKRHYEEGTAFPTIVKEFLKLIKSEAMCAILSNVTGLTLHENAIDDSSNSDDESNSAADDDDYESSSDDDDGNSLDRTANNFNIYAGKETCSNSDSTGKDASTLQKQDNVSADANKEKFDGKKNMNVKSSNCEKKEGTDNKWSVDCENEKYSEIISHNTVDFFRNKNKNVTKNKKIEKTGENYQNPGMNSMQASKCSGISESGKKHKAKMADITNAVRKWKNGCYTLLHDYSNPEASLDSFMHFCCEEWNEDCGGYIAYVASDDGEELLRVEPNCNNLALVYADTESHQFVKYVNNRILKQTSEAAFYDIFTSYFERFS